MLGITVMVTGAVIEGPGDRARHQQAEAGGDEHGGDGEDELLTSRRPVAQEPEQEADERTERDDDRTCEDRQIPGPTHDFPPAQQP